MKRLKFTLFCLSVAFLCYWHPLQYGYCSEQNKPGTQNQPKTTQDITEQQEESKEKTTNDEVISVDPSAPHTSEHSTYTQTGPEDELQTQETGLQEKNEKVDGTTAESVLTAEASVPEHDSDPNAPESSLTSKKHTTDLSPIPAETASEPTSLSESLSPSTTALPGPALCSADDDSCSAASSTAVSATSACEPGDSPPYDMDLTSSLPMVLENTSTPGTGKGTKANLDRNQGTNASSMLKEQSGHMTAETDPSVPSKDPEDIPTFDEWKKIMMEVENEKSQTTHTSCNGGSSTVKKVQKTTNYASVECGAKILSSNPEAKSTSAILMENMDVYMLNPCSNKIWFIIELCQPIQVKQLDIANFELFSSTPKDFLVSISDRYPTNKWAKLGTFHARDERTIQSFPLDEHLYAKYVKMFTKYIKVELLSHFGSEHFCPLSLIRVFGTSMMEEYELNSEPSERLNFEDEDSDYPPGYLPSDDKSSKNLIGSAKDVILNMVNNIAANVLGGNPEDTARTGGNYSSLNPNLTETSGTPETVTPTASYVILETFEEGQHDQKVITETISITEDVRDADQTVPVPPALFTEAPSSLVPPTESLAPATPDEEQIITLLPSEEEDDQNQSEQTSSSVSQEEQLKQETEQDQQYSGVQEMNVSDSCSCLVSLEEYLLQSCFPLPAVQKKRNKKKTKKDSQGSQSQLSTNSQQIHTVPVVTTSSLAEAFLTSTVEMSVPEDSTPHPVPPPLNESEKKPVAGSLDLEPSLTSVLPKPISTDTLTSRATQSVDFLDLLVTEPPQLNLPLHEKTREKTPLLTSPLESTLVLNTKTVQVDNDQKPSSAEQKSTPEKDTLTANTADETPLTPPTDQPVPQPTKTKTAVNTGTLISASVTEHLEGTFVTVEPKAEELLEEAVLGDHSANGQSGQPSSSDFYAEMPSTTDTPIHGSNQKESVFMRLNNRIKALEVNMSLSGRYLEQLSQRYRKQMEEMQKAFNKTIIKLQNTSRIAEEQDQKQTESIQVLQGQLENMTQLVLNLSVRVSQLQREVSDRYSYLLLCLLLCFLLGLAICINFCRLSAETSSVEPDSSVHKTYNYCSPDPATLGYEDVSLKRRASYPFSQSSLQIPTGGPNEASNVDARRNISGNKKKKRCKMKSSTKPEMMTPNVLSASLVPNGTAQCSTLAPQALDLKLSTCLPSPFTFKDPPSEGSSEASSQSDEPSFCGISTCNRLCEALPPPKSRSKRRRSKPACAVVQQLLQPAQHSSSVQPGPTMQGFIKTTTELSAGRVEVTTISGLT